MIINNDLTPQGRVIRILVHATASSADLYVIATRYQNDLILETIPDWSYSSLRYLDYVDSILAAVGSKDISRGTVHTLSNKSDIPRIFQQHTASKIQECLVGFFDDESDFSIGGDTKSEPVETLKCSCFYCQVELTPTQYYKWDTSKYEVVTNCPKCSRSDKVTLSQEQIKSCNKQGGYQMSMGK